jgi:hypothetical protein
MNEVMIGIAGLLLLVGLALTGMELGIAMAVVGFIGFGYIRDFDAAYGVASSDFFETFSSYGLTVIRFLSSWGRLLSTRA